MLSFLTRYLLPVHRNSKSKLYNLLYSLDWGETGSNNFGFAPSPIAAPERFQLQMYDELYQLLPVKGGNGRGARLLEVSCGRGGGLIHLMERPDGPRRAVGLDVAQAAVDACRRRYADLASVEFVQGTALNLPFPDDAFDVVVNIEASNAYDDVDRFFGQVWRVLRPGGAFLYADSRIAKHLPAIERALQDMGFQGSLHDITDNVRQACEEDTARRLRMIRTGLTWNYRLLIGNRLGEYAGVKGSKMYEKFRTRRRIYFMTCMLKPVSAEGP